MLYFITRDSKISEKLEQINFDSKVNLRSKKLNSAQRGQGLWKKYNQDNEDYDFNYENEE